MKNKEKRKIFPLDVCVVLIVVVLLASVALRLYSTAGVTVDNEDLSEYTVAFRCSSVKSSSAKLLVKGESFRVGNGRDFGFLSDNVIITPALYYSQLSDGTYKKVYATENGDNTLLDVSGAFTVRGIENDLGLFLLGGDYYMAPNSSFVVHNDVLSIEIQVLSIKKVG